MNTLKYQLVGHCLSWTCFFCPTPTCSKFNCCSPSCQRRQTLGLLCSSEPPRWKPHHHSYTMNLKEAASHQVQNSQTLWISCVIMFPSPEDRVPVCLFSAKRFRAVNHKERKDRKKSGFRKSFTSCLRTGA